MDGQSITKDDFKERYHHRELAARRGRAADPDGGPRRPPDRGAGQRSRIRSSSSSQSARRRSPSSGSSTPSSRRSWRPRRASAATPADIDARLIDEATTPESRHAWVIEVKPETDPGAVAPTDAQKAAARAKADAALKDLQGGKAWEDVAKTVSTDASTAPQAGDLGWITADDSQTDEAFLKALFAAAANTPTAVIEGTDGIFRIGRVDRDRRRRRSTTPTRPSSRTTRSTWPSTGPSWPATSSTRSSRTRSSPTSPGPARSATCREIYIGEAAPDRGADAIKVRHILYSPNGRPVGASTRRGRRTRRGRPRTTKAVATYDAAQGGPEPVRLDRPRGERREPGPGRDRQRRQAAVLRQRAARRRGVRRRRSWPPASSRASSSSRSSPPSAGTSSRSCTGPPDVDRLTALKAQADGGRRLRDAGPRQLGGRRRPARAATSAGSPRASSTTRLTDGDLRDAGRQDVATS